MAKGPGQKLKLLYLLEILQRESDEAHPLPMASLLKKLEERGVQAERKSVYDDLALLADAGLADVLYTGGKKGGYYLGSRQFELPELKLLVDAVQASKFITQKKSRELIQKLESLASVYDGRLLQRQVYVSGRVKTVNEQIYYNIDKLHEAIGRGVQITFTYLEWQLALTGAKQAVKRPRKNGALYTISPWALTWDDENYYLVGYDKEADQIKHYRVDKMQGLSLLPVQRDGQALFASFDMALYSKKTFGMYGGEEQAVRIQFANRLIGVVTDRFGEKLFLRAEGENAFSAEVSVAVSPLFFSWVAGLGADAKILSPAPVAAQFCRFLQSSLKLYEL